MRRDSLSLWVGTLCALAAAGGARADIADIRIAAHEARARVTIEFDGPVAAAAAAPLADGFLVNVAGAHAREGVLETADRRLVARIEMRPGEAGAALAFFTAVEVLAAQARVENGAAVIDLALAAPVGATGGAAASPSRPPAARAGSRDALGDSHGDAHGGTDGAQDEGSADGEARGPAVLRTGAGDPAGHENAPDDAPTAPGGGPIALGPPEPDGEAAHAEAAHDDAHDEADAAARVDAHDDELRERAPAAPAAGGAAALLAAHLDAAACADAETRVRADPWDLSALSDYGACLALEGRPDEAAEVFERLLTFAPEDPEAHLGLGAARHEAGDLEAARLRYHEALALARTDAAAARARALIATLDEH